MAQSGNDAFVVEVNVQHDADFIDPNAIEDAIRTIAEDYSILRGNVSVAVVDDENMHRMNRQFLQHDYSTDCLSFVYEQSDDALQGELILCADFAAAQAQQYQWASASELLLYAIHGMLHLMGHDDATDLQREQMRKLEREYLQRFGIAGAERHGDSYPTRAGQQQ